MDIAGTIATEAEIRHRKKMASSFGPFKRLLGYVWPQKRYLIPAVSCIILMAVTYSFSLGSIPFILTVLMRPQGLHGWVAQTAIEQQLKATFGVHSWRDADVPGIKDGTVKVTEVKDDSPLLKAGIPGGAFILAVNGQTGKAAEIFKAMVQAGDTMQITYRLPTDLAVETTPAPVTPAAGEPAEPVYVTRQTTVKPKPMDARYRAGLWAVSFIPGGTKPEEKWRTLISVLAVLMTLVLIGNIARFWAEYLTVLVNCRAIMDIRREMYAHILKLPLSHFSRHTTDTMNRVQVDTNDIFRGLSNFFEKVITEPFKALGVTIVAFTWDWKMTLGVMVATPVAALLIRTLGKRIRRANRRALQSYAKMLGALESTLTGMRVVKGYGRENYERKRLFNIDRGVLRQQLKMGRTEALASPALELLAFVAITGAILYFGHGILLKEGEADVTHFITMIVLLAAILDPVRKLTTVYPKIQRANAAAERVFEIIDSPSEYAQDAGKPRIKPLRDSIQFENVTFYYPEATRPAVRNVSLTVKRGEIVALVGANGSGKTTLVSLLPRFFPITSGRILIDGQDINEVSLRSLREQFSLITQDTVIFPDTIRANIAYGKMGASQEEIEEAARKAFADEFIRQMPEGYDTVVGEHGATLSGGQKQRISIARAILRNAPITIFDEATSQVDSESEMKIHNALDLFLKDRTAFIIAHRFSTIANAHRIVVMDGGEVVAIGKHDELLQSCPMYVRLYENQFRNPG
ncbi:MAG TPA: ABC transporter transmembrane domain-containing protein [Phycisphaerae bacterium]|nr:ABC transporter transmembrane domain-containing protein [Phycisphaerae bacterium]HOJ73330.1 ABC transporter transmembrane domain-containing protein [Phycisphaerae bacterium]HOM50938.1 ABC transporter transmembrane domain-containing protein [Phycisphaerae bacterium]HON66679.1 ABC transporter transmembrane domain-containing protein [Phycisphaerae bacterium]HOQ84436.1 ABC transporter transmembrane domain-containing protein [Phycisphaerae bacterium]